MTPDQWQRLPDACDGANVAGVLREIWGFVEAKQRAGHRVALARLVERTGPGARPVGVLMAVSDDGEWAGSVSGGCVEREVLDRARDLLAAGTGAVTTLVPEEIQMPWEPAPSCTASMRVLVTPAPTGQVSAAISTALAADERLPVATSLREPFGWQVGEDVERWSQVQDAHVEVVEPRPLLLVVGATDLAAALAGLGTAVGRCVVVVDPRPDYATPQRVPEAVEVVRAWPQEWVAAHPLEQRDAALVVTHDARIDDAALRALLPGRAGHVAVLGSRATHGQRLERLADVPGIERLVGPAGLDLGGTSVAEMALSMLAEVVAVGNGRAGGRLRDGSGPVQSP